MKLHIVVVQTFDIPVLIGYGSYYSDKIGTIGFQVHILIIHPKQHFFRTTGGMHFVRSNHFTVYQAFCPQEYFILLFLT